MNEAEACAHLDLKFEELKLHFPDSARRVLDRTGYFAGGCIRSLLRDERPFDYDVFSTEDLTFAMMYLQDFFDHVSRYAGTWGEFQIITRYFGEPRDNVSEFDFEHNMTWYCPGSGKIESFYDVDAEELAQDNELHFNVRRAREVERVYTRIPKFLDRGMTISQEEKEKILSACPHPEALDLENYCFRERDENGNYGGGEK